MVKKTDIVFLKGFTVVELQAAFNRVASRSNKHIRKGGFKCLVSEVKNPGKKNIRCAKVAIRFFTGLRTQVVPSADGAKVLFVAS